MQESLLISEMRPVINIFQFTGKYAQVGGGMAGSAVRNNKCSRWSVKRGSSVTPCILAGMNLCFGRYQPINFEKSLER